MRAAATCDDAAAAAAASLLATHPDYRVTRRLAPPPGGRSVAVRGGMLAGCALDVETTGLDHREDAIIELAVRRFWADADGAVVVAGRPHRWLEDPRRPIAPGIARLTGLSDADVAGRSIIDAEAATLIADADFVVAHNAAFDRPFVERRLPGAAGGRWVCSMADVDWRGLGFEGRSLSHLLLQAGWFYEAHRASIDVDALITLLGHPLPDGGTVLLRALERATRPTWMVEAVRAPFERSPLLRARGYRWEPVSRCWRREVGDDAVDDEIGWATSEVYRGSARPRFRRMTWRQRYAAPAAAGVAGAA